MLLAHKVIPVVDLLIISLEEFRKETFDDAIASF